MKTVTFVTHNYVYFVHSSVSCEILKEKQKSYKSNCLRRKNHTLVGVYTNAYKCKYCSIWCGVTGTVDIALTGHKP